MMQMEICRGQIVELKKFINFLSELSIVIGNYFFYDW